MFWWLVQPLVLQLKSLGVLSVYAWLRVFLNEEESADDGSARMDGATLLYGAALALVLFLFVFYLTWRVERTIYNLEMRQKMQHKAHSATEAAQHVALCSWRRQAPRTPPAPRGAGRATRPSFST